MSCCTKRFVTSCFGFEDSQTSPSFHNFPRSITATLLQILRITFISCVIKTIVKCNFLLIANKSQYFFCCLWIYALVASSQSKISGSFANARAIPTRCFVRRKVVKDRHCPRPLTRLNATVLLPVLYVCFRYAS